MDFFRTFVTIGSLVCSAIGCQGDSRTPAGRSSSDSEQGQTSADDRHVHPTHGPHEGTLVELGNEEFHAEVTSDQSTVTVYILDSHAAQSVPIDAAEVTINLLQDGSPQQYKLSANPEASDPEGKSSRFSLVDAQLPPQLVAPAAAPKLSLFIGGTPYRGEIKHAAHSHNHEH